VFANEIGEANAEIAKYTEEIEGVKLKITSKKSEKTKLENTIEQAEIK
jgi:hypothetical protein